MVKTQPKPKRGRPTIGAEPMLRVLVTLDPASINRAKKLGRGNLSAGLRKALLGGKA